MDQMTPEQIAHRQIMDEVNKAYKETPIDPKNEKLKVFAEKIKDRGFNFDPREICKMIDAEAKRQYQETFDFFFKGQHLDTLTNAKDETIQWFNDEEARFTAFKDNYLKAPEEVLATPVENVTPIKKGKKSK